MDDFWGFHGRLHGIYRDAIVRTKHLENQGFEDILPSSMGRLHNGVVLQFSIQSDPRLVNPVNQRN